MQAFNLELDVQRRVEELEIQKGCQYECDSSCFFGEM